MKKSVRSLPVAEAVKQARADLHLEYAAVPEWGHFHPTRNRATLPG